MRAVLTILLVVTILQVCGQNQSVQSFLDSAKLEFQKDFELQDYSKAVELLETIVLLEPNNAEGHYFLGYAYSRLNAKDGTSLIDMDLSLLMKASYHFERVIELEPKYLGEQVLLDPYSKLTAEWGSMAMSYWWKEQPDSARWAFAEGKKRGGYRDFLLQINAATLKSCAPNAILLSSGDNITFPLYYQQIVNNLRPDVSVIDINLLNSKWYPNFLKYSKMVEFDLSGSSLDNIGHRKWSDSTLTIKNFTWVVPPSYSQQYLLRGDQILLNILRTNMIERDFYFTAGVPNDMKLGLVPHLYSKVVTERFSPGSIEPNEFSGFKKSIISLLQLANQIDGHSSDEILTFGMVRNGLMKRANWELERGNVENARELMNLLDANSERYDIPYNQYEERYRQFILDKM